MQRSGFLIVHTRRIAYRLNGIIHRRILVARTPAIVCAMAPTRRQVSSLASSAVALPEMPAARNRKRQQHSE